jgi:hypothetical protein
LLPHYGKIILDLNIKNAKRMGFKLVIEIGTSHVFLAKDEKEKSK